MIMHHKIGMLNELLKTNPIKSAFMGKKRDQTCMRIGHLMNMLIILFLLVNGPCTFTSTGFLFMLLLAAALQRYEILFFLTLLQGCVLYLLLRNQCRVSLQFERSLGECLI